MPPQTARGDQLSHRTDLSLTIEGIAARAGVAKTTIYRSWPSKAAVVMDAVLVESDPRVSFPDTGSAQEDLRLQISRVATATSYAPTSM